MKPVQVDELSALLDGELDQEREREVLKQLAIDSGLHAEFEALVALDARWKSAAATASFVASVRKHSERQRGVRSFIVVPLLLPLLFVRLVPRYLDAQMLAWGLNAAAFLVVLGMIVLHMPPGKKRVQQ